MIKPLQQPMGSKLCGQTCVAMIAGVSIEEATAAVGRKGCSRPIDWHNGLKKFGIESAKKSLRFNKRRPLPDLMIAITKHPRQSITHAIVVYKGQIFDPLPRQFTENWRMVSYVPVFKEFTSKGDDVPSSTSATDQARVGMG